MGMGTYKYAAAPGITPGATSYFSAPSNELDPELFQNMPSTVRPSCTNQAA